MSGDFHGKEFFEVFGEPEGAGSTRAPSTLKARIYSALVNKQTETGPLLSLTETKERGERLCVFEEIVRIAPLGETAKAANHCRVCHARIMAEHIENAPIFWEGCPYVQLKNS